jgi:hypothetical protein
LLHEKITIGALIDESPKCLQESPAKFSAGGIHKYLSLLFTGYIGIGNHKALYAA